MHNFVFLSIIIALSLVAYNIGVSKSKRYISVRKATRKGNNISDGMSSLPSHYGYCMTLWTIIPTIALGIFIYQQDQRVVSDLLFINGNFVASAIIFIVSAIVSYQFLKPSFKARDHSEKVIKLILLLSATISISITALIFFSVLFESLRFFEKVNVFEFFFGLEWSPQTALRSDQAGSSGKFGIIPVFMGTLLITFIAMLVSVPLGLLSAIYLTEYSSSKFRSYVKPLLEILAGIPTVVYGYFAAVTLGPLLRQFIEQFGINIASESAMAAGFVMGIMIIPYMMSLADDVMSAVPRSLRDASLGLGATKSETIKKVVIPAALPGIMGAFLLAVSRAIGETMIVVMAAGLIAKLTFNPFESVTTVTAQIVKLLVGDQEFDSAKTLAAFALSLTLFMLTLLLNIVAISIVKKYREKYE